MRIPLNFPRSPAGTASAARSSPPKQASFADRLAANRRPEPKQPTAAASNPAPADGADAQAEALLRESIEQYLLQNTLMQRIMATPGPLPDRNSD